VPRTAVGAGVEVVAAAAPDGDGDDAGDGAGVTAGDADAVTDGDNEATDAEDAAAAFGEVVAPAWVADGRSAIDPVDDARAAAAPSARSPTIATIGTRPNRLPSGKRSRQFGQNPETGVVT
jgi:hypothetical protein